MTKEELISKIEELILKGQELKNSIYLFRQDTFFNYYKSSKEEEYKKWVQSIKRLIDTMFPSSKERLKPYENNISPENPMAILGILQGIKEFPYEPKNEVKEKSLDGITINNTQNNTQNNAQQVILNVFIEAIKDEITGKELKELKEIMKNYEKNPEETKSTLLEKIKGFGKDVLSNIMANIITNPDFYSTFLN